MKTALDHVEQRVRESVDQLKWLPTEIRVASDIWAIAIRAGREVIETSRGPVPITCDRRAHQGSYYAKNEYDGPLHPEWEPSHREIL